MEQLDNTEWKITSSLHLACYALTICWQFPAGSFVLQTFAKLFSHFFSDRKPCTYLLSSVCWFLHCFLAWKLLHWFIEYQFRIDFCIFEINFFFPPSALVVNEEKARHFHGYTSEYSSIHLLYIWYFMSINKKGAKLGLRLFWRM